MTVAERLSRRRQRFFVAVATVALGVAIPPGFRFVRRLHRLGGRTTPC